MDYFNTLSVEGMPWVATTFILCFLAGACASRQGISRRLPGEGWLCSTLNFALMTPTGHPAL